MANETNENVMEATNGVANATADVASVMMKNVKVKNHALNITSLVLVAVLFAAGCILDFTVAKPCLLYTSPSPRDGLLSRMPSSA